MAREHNAHHRDREHGHLTVLARICMLAPHPSHTVGAVSGLTSSWVPRLPIVDSRPGWETVRRLPNRVIFPGVSSVVVQYQHPLRSLVRRQIRTHVPPTRTRLLGKAKASDLLGRVLMTLRPPSSQIGCATARGLEARTSPWGWVDRPSGTRGPGPSPNLAGRRVLRARRPRPARATPIGIRMTVFEREETEWMYVRE